MSDDNSGKTPGQVGQAPPVPRQPRPPTTNPPQPRPPASYGRPLTPDPQWHSSTPPSRYPWPQQPAPGPPPPYPYQHQQPPSYDEPWPPYPRPFTPEAARPPAYGYPDQVSGTNILGLGILSLLCLGIVTGPIAIGYGVVSLSSVLRGRADPSQKGLIIAGIVCGAIGTLIAASHHSILELGRILFPV